MPNPPKIFGTKAKVPVFAVEECDSDGQPPVNAMSNNSNLCCRNPSYVKFVVCVDDRGAQPEKPRDQKQEAEGNRYDSRPTRFVHRCYFRCHDQPKAWYTTTYKSHKSYEMTALNWYELLLPETGTVKTVGGFLHKADGGIQYSDINELFTEDHLRRLFDSVNLNGEGGGLPVTHNTLLTCLDVFKCGWNKNQVRIVAGPHGSPTEPRDHVTVRLPNGYNATMLHVLLSSDVPPAAEGSDRGNHPVKVGGKPFYAVLSGGGALVGIQGRPFNTKANATPDEVKKGWDFIPLNEFIGTPRGAELAAALRES